MKTLVLILPFLCAAALVSAQHHQHGDNPSEDQQNQSEQHHGHEVDSTTVPMSHSYSLNLPMNRNGSGTGWLPDNSPIYAYMFHSRRWMYMAHGNIFVRYNHQDIGRKGKRGDSKVDAPNWFMFMGQRRVGQNGLFHFNTMFSLDPLFGGDGYPLLFQTGETFEGKPLVDRQHPHNLFSELSVSYSQAFSKDLDAFIYFGYPGEPALGPVAFMHRPSSLNNLDSPLGHHWQDATHITFGVATVGLRYKIFKADASLFTGREPGEARYGLDKPRFDSYSYRLTVNPTRSISAQVSRAFIKSPEAIDPSENVTRTTASLLHTAVLNRQNTSVSSALIWGFNDSGDHHQENSFTLESNLQLNRFALYGRYEAIEKSAEELLLPEFNHDQLFRINAATLGLNYAVLQQIKTNFSIGVQGTLYTTTEALAPIYGKNPMALELYLRISPQQINLN